MLLRIRIVLAENDMLDNRKFAKADYAMNKRIEEFRIMRG